MPRDDVVFPTRTPVTLIHRLREGRHDDWHTFHGIYGPMVCRLAEMGGLRQQDALEVTAIVMTRLAERLLTGLRVDHQKGRFRDYVAAVTRRVAAAYRRDMRRRAAVSLHDDLLADPAPSPVDELATLEQCARLKLCLDMLRHAPDVRNRNLRAFERYVIMGEPPAKVAKRYGITCQRLYEIKREMCERLKNMLLKLDLEIGEA